MLQGWRGRSRFCWIMCVAVSPPSTMRGAQSASVAARRPSASTEAMLPSHGMPLRRRIAPAARSHTVRKISATT